MAFDAVDRRLSQLWHRYVALQRVQEENQLLRRENERLRGQLAALQEMAVANQRLAALLDFRAQMPVQTVAARVIGRDASHGSRGAVLDKGEQHGIRSDMGVVTPAGAVGRVVKTGTSYSVVQFITDPNNAVTARIQRTRDEGIIQGTYDGRVQMKYIPLLSAVQVGDSVVTSGLTGGFPPGVPIGVITSLLKQDDELFQTAEIQPEVNFSKLEEVLVVTVPRSVEGWPSAHQERTETEGGP
jgi:rod shape-determining protein MreC